MVFDAKNKDHRKYWFQFVVTKTWGQCPCRFVVDDASADLVTQIQREVVEYYSGREFGGRSQFITK